MKPIQQLLFMTCGGRNASDATLAQLVEQRTENPCVPCSSQGGGTKMRLSNRATFSLSVKGPQYV